MHLPPTQRRSGSGGSAWYGLDAVQVGLHVEVYDFFLEGLVAGVGP